MRTCIPMLLLSIFIVAGCSEKQREGWEKRIERIAEQGKEEGSPDSPKSEDITLADDVKKLIDLETAPVERGEIDDILEVPAKIAPHPDHSIVLRSPIRGRITALSADLGSDVSENAVIVVVEDPQNLGQRLQIRSPLTGVVVARPVSVGEWVESGAEVAQIVDFRTVQGIVYLYPDDLAKVRPGQIVEFQGEGATAVGKLSYVSPEAHGSGRVEAWADIDNSTTRLKTNAYVSGRILVGRKTGLVIPQSAVLAEEANFIVFVEVGDRFEKRPVDVGIRWHGRVEVLGGLNEGDIVVTQGAHELKNITFSSSALPETEDEP